MAKLFLPLWRDSSRQFQGKIIAAPGCRQVSKYHSKTLKQFPQWPGLALSLEFDQFISTEKCGTAWRSG
jgi:hypothetical protein